MKDVTIHITTSMRRFPNYPTSRKELDYQKPAVRRNSNRWRLDSCQPPIGCQQLLHTARVKDLLHAAPIVFHQVCHQNFVYKTAAFFNGQSVVWWLSSKWCYQL